MTKYRIVDVVDNHYNLTYIEVRKRTLSDMIFFPTHWWYEKRFDYNENKNVYPNRTKAEAIAEAEKWIEDEKNGEHKVKNIVIKTV